MKPVTEYAIEQCLKFNGGRSGPDKSFPFILPLIQKRDGNILDIGCGRGTAGMIIHYEFSGERSVIGIDINGRNCFDSDTGRWYIEYFSCDYRLVYKYLPIYSIYLFINVIEDFDKSVSVDIINYLKLNCDGSSIIASIPNAPKHWNQSSGFEAANPHEAHRHNWTNAEVERDLGLRLVGENDGVGVFAHGI